MRKHRKFDLDAALIGLFQRAQKNGDYSGCASLARVIRDMARRDDTPDGVAVKEREAIVDALTDDERTDLESHLRAIRAIRTNVAIRIGLRSADVEPAPRPAIEQTAQDATPDPTEPDQIVPEPQPDPNERITVNTIRGPMEITRAELDRGWRVE